MKLGLKSAGLLIIVIIGMPLLTRAQTEVFQPVKWNFIVAPINESEAELIFTASLEDDWNLYSQFIGTNGPVPTTFTFLPSDDYSLIGNVKELCVPKKVYSQLFRMNLLWFEKTAAFLQKVKVHSSTAVIKGKIEFMLAREEEFLPPEQIEFSLAVNVKKPERKRMNELVITSIDTSHQVKEGATEMDTFTKATREDLNVLTQAEKPSPAVVLLTVLVCFCILTVMLLPFIVKQRMASGGLKTSQLFSFFLFTGKAWRAIVRKRESS